VSDGSVNAARGARGGGLGGPADHRKRKRDGSIEVLSNCAQVKLAEGETILSVCCGGGGYGAPDERDPHLVINDVVEGRISRERAREIYKVVIGEDGQYDELATSALRSRM
jgi:N-methylhydantoinase B